MNLFVQHSYAEIDPKYAAENTLLYMDKRISRKSSVIQDAERAVLKYRDCLTEDRVVGCGYGCAASVLPFSSHNQRWFNYHKWQERADADPELAKNNPLLYQVERINNEFHIVTNVDDSIFV